MWLLSRNGKNATEIDAEGVTVTAPEKKFYPWGDIGKGGGGGGAVDEEARAAAAAAQATADNAATTAGEAQTSAETAQTTADTALDIAAACVPYDLETEEPIVINFHHLASGNGGESSLTLTVSSVWDSGGEELPIQTIENNFMKIDLMAGTIIFYPGTPAQKLLNLYSLAG